MARNQASSSSLLLLSSALSQANNDIDHHANNENKYNDEIDEDIFGPILSKKEMAKRNQSSSLVKLPSALSQTNNHKNINNVKPDEDLFYDTIESIRHLHVDDNHNISNNDNTTSASASASASASEVEVINHFSLGSSSSNIRFRNTNVHMYGDAENQFVIEDRIEEASASSNKKNNKRILTVKHISTISSGLIFLRTIYTLVSFLVFAFLFVFCFQCIIFLFLNLYSSTTIKHNYSAVIGTLFSIPIFIYGMASIMTLGWLFVIETWKGHKLLLKILPWIIRYSTIIEWVTFIIFLGIPSLAMIITLFARFDNWWEVSALVWVISVFIFMVIYGIIIIYCETISYFRLIQIYYKTTTNDNNIDDDDDNHSNSDNNDKNVPKWKKISKLILKAIYLRQRYVYSGMRYERYLIKDDKDQQPSPSQSPSNNHNMINNNNVGYINNKDYTPVRTFVSWYSKITQLHCLVDGSRFNIFEKLDNPKRIYGLDEIRDETMLMTKEIWSLESMFCRKKDSKIIIVASSSSNNDSNNSYIGNKIIDNKNHRHALGSSQIWSSMICQCIGMLLIIFLIISFMSWIQFGPALICVVLLFIILLCIFPTVRRLLPLYRSLKPIFSTTNNDNENDNENNNNNYINNYPTTTIYQVKWEQVRITQPKENICYIISFIYFILFFLWPFISLFAAQNYPIGGVFCFLGTLSFIRMHFNISSLLGELGRIDNLYFTIDKNEKLIQIDKEMDRYCCCNNRICKKIYTFLKQMFGISNDEEEILHQEEVNIFERSRIADIIAQTRGNSHIGWIYAYCVLFIIVLAIVIVSGAPGSVSSQYNFKGTTLVTDFYYPPQTSNVDGTGGNLPYQTCQLGKGFGLDLTNDYSINNDNPSILMTDYVLLAAAGYLGPNEAQEVLDAYFGKNKVIDEYEFVNKYRQDKDLVDNPVSFKLFSFTDYPNHAVMSIRGSEYMFDWIVNAQLWSCAILAQTVRFIMPMGQLWTPIYPRLVAMSNSVESANLRAISSYTATTRFVNDIIDGWDNNPFKILRITGHSLGGGTAIITGAQTGVSTIAVSGPNSMLSRRTFDPPLTKEQINKRVINVIPDRDIVPRIDDPGNLYQRIECRARKNDIFGCHAGYRTLCEFAYQCGSQGRPILCWCVSKYGYPKPVQNGTLSWEDACATADAL